MHILVVAVGDWLNMVEIREIASDPDVQSVFNVEDFDSLTEISGALKQLLCDGKPCVCLALYP